jgi:hypothetical protein
VRVINLRACVRFTIRGMGGGGCWQLTGARYNQTVTKLYFITRKSSKKD